MFTRRTFLAAAAAAAAAGPLAACGGGNNAGSGGGKELRIYWWGADLRARLTQQVLDLYKQKHPDVTVNPESSEWSGYWDKLATQFAGNDAPDVLQMDEAYIDSYGTKRALLNLEDQKGVLDLSAMDAAILDTGRLADGTLVGAPIGVGIFSVGVNPNVLEKAGVDMPDDKKWTWQDFNDVAAEVSNKLKSDGTTGFDFFGFGAAELGAWARQHHQQIFPRDGETLITVDTITSYLEFAKSLVKSGATPQVSSQVEDNGAGVDQSRFAKNKSAFHLQFHTQIQAFQATSGDPLKLLRLPAVTSGDPQMVNKASMYWSVAARSKSAEAAAQLVSFFMTDPDAAKILKVERGVTGIPAMQDAIEPELDEIGKVSLKFAQDMQKEVVKPPLVTPASGVGFGADFTRLAQDALFNRRPAADVANDIMGSVTSMQPQK